MKRALTTIVFALLAVFAAVPAVAAAPAPRVVEVRAARFPQRSFVLTLPSTSRLAARDVEVRENGRLASGLSLVPAGAVKRQFGIVLVVDASDSMRGEAIDGAVAAARAFAERRNARQPLALVIFNSTASVTLPFTTDRLAIGRALRAPPPLAHGTRVYDAIGKALTLLSRARIGAGSVVVLSDGADTGSRTTEIAIGARAAAARVRVFSVGLRSTSFRAGPLRRLAARTGGRYSEASTGEQLTQIYDELGGQLASEYLLRYASTAFPGERVHVHVDVNGFMDAAVASYRAPSVRSVGERFWNSTLTMIVVSLLAALLLALAVGALVASRTGSVRRRVAAFAAAPQEPGQGKSVALVTEKVLTGTETVLERSRWWPRLRDALDVAQISIPAAYVVLGTIAGTVLVMFLLAAVTGSAPAALLGLIMPLVVHVWIKRRLAVVRSRFAEQLPDNLQVLASALRAGHSLVGALSVVVGDAPEPSRREFRRAVADEQLGAQLEDTLDAIVARMKSPELEYVSLVTALHRQTGGNTAEVLDRITDTIRDRADLRRMVKTLTAQGRMARWIVSLLPLALLGAIIVLNPGYMEPMFERPIGWVLLGSAGAMVVAGSLLIKRIVEIEP